MEREERALNGYAQSGREHGAAVLVPAILGSRRTIDTLLHVTLACFGWAARARDAGFLTYPGGLLVGAAPTSPTLGLRWCAVKVFLVWSCAV